MDVIIKKNNEDKSDKYKIFISAIFSNILNIENNYSCYTTFLLFYTKL